MEFTAVQAVAAMVMMAMLDAGVIMRARDFLLDFLRGGTGKKRFRQLVRQPPLWQRITLSYVQDYIREPAFIRPFRFYSTVYRVCLALIPCHGALCALAAFGVISMPRLFCVSAVCCVALGAVYYFERPQKEYSRYAGRKYRKKIKR